MKKVRKVDRGFSTGRHGASGLMLDIQETDATIVGLDGSPPAGQGEMLFDKLGKMRCARTRSIDLGI